MVFHDDNEATKTGVGANRIINKMHNLAWLKHQVTDANQNVREEGEMSENPQGKKNKKKGRSKPHNSKGQKGAGNNNQKTLAATVMGGKPSATPQNAWVLGRSAAGELFPNAEFVKNDEFMSETEREQVKLAMEESLKDMSNQLMDKCVIDEIPESIQEEAQETPQKNEKVEEATVMSEDDRYWCQTNSNLPSPGDNEKSKNFDSNNNSGLGNVTNSSIKMKNMEYKGRSITKTGIDETPKTGISFDTSLITAIDPSHIDKFGRPGGRSETHLFMGKGGRMREQQYLEQLKHGNSSMISTKPPPQQQDENKIDEIRLTNNSMMQERTSNNNSQDKRSMNYQQEKYTTKQSQERSVANFQQQRQSLNFSSDKQPPDFPPKRCSSYFSSDKQPSNFPPPRRGSNYRNLPRERQSSNYQDERRSSNYQDDRRSSNNSRPGVRSFPPDKYHYDSRIQKNIRESRDYSHGNMKVNHDEKPLREEDFQKSDEPQKIIKETESSIRTSDRVVEKSKNENIEESQETANNRSESFENCSEIIITELPRLADFNSRTNVPIIDENPNIPIYSSDNVSNCPSPDQGSQTSHYSDAIANFSQNDEFSQYATFYEAPPGFQFLTQSSQNCAGQSYVKSEESPYASLQLTDPGLYKLFMQKRNRDCCAHRENCSNYENYLVPVDPTELMKCYGNNVPTPEQQVWNYQHEQSPKFPGTLSYQPPSLAQMTQGEMLDFMEDNDSQYLCESHNSEGGHENLQIPMENALVVSGTDSTGHVVSYGNNRQEIQIPYQNVQRPLNLQPMIQGYQNYPPRFIGVNNTNLPTQYSSHQHYLPFAYYQSNPVVHGNEPRPQILQKLPHSQSMSLPKQLNNDHANISNQRNFSNREQSPIISQKDYDNCGAVGGNNSSNFSNEENFDRGYMRNDVQPKGRNIYGNYGNNVGKISHNMTKEKNFNSRRERHHEIPQRSSNFDISQTSRKPLFRKFDNEPGPSHGYGRGRINRNH